MSIKIPLCHALSRRVATILCLLTLAACGGGGGGGAPGNGGGNMPPPSNDGLTINMPRRVFTGSGSSGRTESMYLAINSTDGSVMVEQLVADGNDDFTYIDPDATGTVTFSIVNLLETDMETFGNIATFIDVPVGLYDFGGQFDAAPPGRTSCGFQYFIDVTNIPADAFAVELRSAALPGGGVTRSFDADNAAQDTERFGPFTTCSSRSGSSGTLDLVAIANATEYRANASAPSFAAIQAAPVSGNQALIVPLDLVTSQQLISVNRDGSTGALSSPAATFVVNGQSVRTPGFVSVGRISLPLPSGGGYQLSAVEVGIGNVMTTTGLEPDDVDESSLGSYILTPKFGRNFNLDRAQRRFSWTRPNNPSSNFSRLRSVISDLGDLNDDGIEDDLVLQVVWNIYFDPNAVSGALDIPQIPANTASIDLNVPADSREYVSVQVSAQGSSFAGFWGTPANFVLIDRINAEDIADSGSGFSSLNPFLVESVRPVAGLTVSVASARETM